MHTLLRRFCCTLILCLLALPALAASCGEQPIKLATTVVLEAILRKDYGCRTGRAPSTTATLEMALVKDDIQIIAEQWVGR